MMKNYILLILILSISTISNANGYISRIFEDEINEADIIIEATLVQKSSKNEQIQRAVYGDSMDIVGSIQESIFTTFIFSVENVIKGEYKYEKIKVMMLGGCDDGLGYCDEYSFNYDYKINERAVLFLKYDSNLKAFETTQGSDTAFAFSQNGILIRKSSDKQSSTSFEIRDNGQIVTKNSLTLELLQEEVEKVENKNEK